MLIASGSGQGQASLSIIVVVACRSAVVVDLKRLHACGDGGTGIAAAWDQGKQTTAGRPRIGERRFDGDRRGDVGLNGWHNHGGGITERTRPCQIYGQGARDVKTLWQIGCTGRGQRQFNGLVHGCLTHCCTCITATIRIVERDVVVSNNHFHLEVKARSHSIVAVRPEVEAHAGTRANNGTDVVCYIYMPATYIIEKPLTFIFCRAFIDLQIIIAICGDCTSQLQVIAFRSRQHQYAAAVFGIFAAGTAIVIDLKRPDAIRDGEIDYSVSLQIDMKTSLSRLVIGEGRSNRNLRVRHDKRSLVVGIETIPLVTLHIDGLVTISHADAVDDIAVVGRCCQGDNLRSLRCGLVADDGTMTIGVVDGNGITLVPINQFNRQAQTSKSILWRTIVIETDSHGITCTIDIINVKPGIIRKTSYVSKESFFVYSLCAVVNIEGHDVLLKRTEESAQFQFIACRCRQNKSTVADTAIFIVLSTIVIESERRHALRDCSSDNSVCRHIDIETVVNRLLSGER